MPQDSSSIEEIVNEMASAESLDLSRALSSRPSIDLLLKEDIEAAKNAGYPTRECLRPHEVEAFAAKAQLSADQKEHATNCRFCATLLGSLIIKQNKLEDFIKEVRKRNRTPSASSRGRQSPEHDINALAASSNARRHSQGPDAERQALRLIGRALKNLATRLDKRQDRRSEFRHAISWVLTTLPSRQTWDQDLIIQADTEQWPGWAVECLPRLYVPLSESGRSALVWHYLIACIPRHYPCEVLEELCNGVVYEVHMAEKTARLVAALAPHFEENRAGNPYPSNEAMRNVAVETMHAESESKGGEQAKAIKDAMEGIIRADAFLPRFNEIVSALELLAAARSINDDAPLASIARAVVTLYPDSRKELEKELRAKGKARLCAAIA